MSAPTTATPRGTASVIELEIATETGPGWLGSGGEPVTVSLTAESVRFDGSQLHFVTGNTVVRTVPRSEVTALTWRGSPPRGRAPGPYRNAGLIWTEEERARLTAEVLGDLSWIEISNRHERSVSAVRREAVRMRLVDEIGRRLDLPAPATTHSTYASPPPRPPALAATHAALTPPRSPSPLHPATATAAAPSTPSAAAPSTTALTPTPRPSPLSAMPQRTSRHPID